MTPLLVLTVSGLVLLSFVAGIALGIAASRGKVRKAETDLLDGLYARRALIDHIRGNREQAARMVA